MTDRIKTSPLTGLRRTLMGCFTGGRAGTARPARATPAAISARDPGHFAKPASPHGRPSDEVDRMVSRKFRETHGDAMQTLDALLDPSTHRAVRQRDDIEPWETSR